MKALITTIWDDPEPIIRGFNITKPDFLILIVDKDTKEQQKETLKKLKEFHKSLDRDVRLEVEKLKVYELYQIAQETFKIINKYQNYDYYIDITASSKPQSVAVALGAMTSEKVKQIFITNKDETVMQMPLLKIYLSENERIILKALNKYEGKKIDVDKITKETNFKQSTIYKYLLEFKNKGYIEENEDKTIQLTTTGKFVML